MKKQGIKKSAVFYLIVVVVAFIATAIVKAVVGDSIPEDYTYISSVAVFFVISVITYIACEKFGVK